MKTKMRNWGLGWMASICLALNLAGTGLQGQEVSKPGGVDLRIVGGTVADAADYPWMVGLVSGDESDLTNAQFCGGSLIAPTWVITAAHCVENEIPGNVDVVIGAGDLRDSSSFQRIRVARIITHPGYFDFDDGIDADIALLELSEAVEGQALLQLIDNEELAQPGAMSRAIGWGLTSEGGDASPQLREVDLPIVSLETATATGAYDMELSADMLPAGFPGGGKDSCNGDSGGPLVVRNQANDGFVLAGIVSFGSHLGCAAPNAYGIYTRVTYFLDWIERGVAGELELTEIGGQGSDANNAGDFSETDFPWDDFEDLGDEFPDFDFGEFGDDEFLDEDPDGMFFDEDQLGDDEGDFFWMDPFWSEDEFEDPNGDGFDDWDFIDDDFGAGEDDCPDHSDEFDYDFESELAELSDPEWIAIWDLLTSEDGFDDMESDGMFLDEGDLEPVTDENDGWDRFFWWN